MQIHLQVDQHQPVLALAEKAQHECSRSETRTIDGARQLATEHRVLSTEPQQIRVQLHRLRVAGAFGRIQLAALEGLRIGRPRHRLLHLRGCHAAKLLHEFLAPGIDRIRQVRWMIGEIEEG